MCYLIQHHSQRPHIRFLPINLLRQPLGGHIQRRPNIKVLEVLFVELRQSKVSYFRSTMLQKDITSLKVSMCHSHLPHVRQPSVEVAGYPAELVPCNRLFIFEMLLKTTTLTQLSDNIAIPLRDQRLFEPKYVRMTHFLQNAYLFKNKTLQMTTLKCIQRYYLDSNREFYFRKGILVRRCCPL